MMDWRVDDTWIVIIGALCAASCGLVGTFLVLRRLSMMGDAISHAVLPGLAAAYLLTESRASIVMFVGAAVVGVLTAAFTQWIHTFGRVDRGAAMGVVFTTLFAIGLLLIVRAADKVDLDAGCVLFGAIELAPLDRLAVGPFRIPRAALVLGVVLLLDLVCVIVLFKELKISAFDPALATTLGINATFCHYVLMTLVAVTTVAAFEAIGSILVIAMLIVPAATAHLLTDRLVPMLLVSLAVGVLSSALGHAGALAVPPLLGFASTSTSGMMAVAAGILFVTAMIAAPRHGIASRVAHRLALRRRIVREDVLALLYRADEQSPHQPAALPGVAIGRALYLGPLRLWFALAGLRARRLITREADAWALTGAGRARATELVRRHRLWESFLYQNLPLPADHVHASAERLEHVTGPAMQDELLRATDRPTHDPHGKPIP